MYEYIRGTLQAITPSKVILEANGIGYAISIPLNAYADLMQIGQEILLHLSFVVKEDSHTLYGFLKKEEKEFFEMVKTVSGVGPKTALALIGHLNLELFHQAISNNDIRLISQVPGIGKKTAERLIIDLKDKVLNLAKKGLISFSGAHENQDHVFDAINALITLGYSPLKAKKAVQESMQDDKNLKDTAAIITKALQRL